MNHVISKSKTLNQLAQATFARLADSFSKDWIPVNVLWMGDYTPEGSDTSYSANIIPASGMSITHNFLNDGEAWRSPQGILHVNHHRECSIFGWSYREGIKEGVLTKRRKVYDKIVTFLGVYVYTKYVTKEDSCTLQEILADLVMEMPYLSHFAVYTANERAEHAQFELYKIPKHVFQFNSKM